MAGTRTRYVVLNRLSAGTWSERGAFLAYSPENAIRLALESAVERAPGDPSGETFVAVPERSWRPLTVSAATQMVFRFDSEASGPEPG